jgi:hypothetical protein
MKKPNRALLNRYLLTGAGIGLYFGAFYRPIVEREPNLFMPIALGIVGGLITAGVRVWRTRPVTPLIAVQQGVTSVLAFVLFLVMMELRIWAFTQGGRLAVVLLTTVTGILIGVGLAYFQGSPTGPD